MIEFQTNVILKIITSISLLSLKPTKFARQLANILGARLMYAANEVKITRSGLRECVQSITITKLLVIDDITSPKRVLFFNDHPSYFIEEQCMELTERRYCA